MRSDFSGPGGKLNRSQSVLPCLAALIKQKIAADEEILLYAICMDVNNLKHHGTGNYLSLRSELG